MPDESSQRITAYIRDLFLPQDDVLDAALRRAREAGLRSIQVPPEVGRLLGILARAIGARRILEIGTLGGYSAIQLARALPEDGRLITLARDRGMPRSRARTWRRQGCRPGWRCAVGVRSTCSRAARPRRPSTSRSSTPPKTPIPLTSTGASGSSVPVG